MKNHNMRTLSMHWCENICNKSSGTLSLICFDIMYIFTCKLTTENDSHEDIPYRHRRAENSLMNNEYFQGFLTMRTPSTLIQALCVFSILFVELVLTKRPPCEAGRWRYSEGKGRCVRCRCPKGTQLSGSEVGSRTILVWNFLTKMW